jgi:NAD(P)-dependent dehydrogenase (short-subunit alcohol dehydrogenase family)
MVDGIGFGKVAIITGCASGVGLATTQVFLSHQYEVLGVDEGSGSLPFPSRGFDKRWGM